MSDNDEATTAAIAIGVIFGVAVIGGTVVFIYLYFYFKRHKRFPWQEATGISYCPPVADYHEIEDLRANRARNAYDYADLDEGATKIVVKRKDNGEYDHIGDKIKFAAVRYDTTASSVQIIASAENPGGEPVYTYNHLATTSDLKVPHNRYEVVEVLGSTPRSPAGGTGVSPNYNFLAVTKPETHITNEYDKPAVQEHPSNEVLGESSLKFEGSPCNMSDEQKSREFITNGNKDSDESVEISQSDQRDEEQKTKTGQIYEYASAMDATQIKKQTQTPTYEDAQSLGATQGGSNTLPKKPRVLKRNRSYDLATLPSRKTTTSQTEEKRDKDEMKNLIKQFEKATPRSVPLCDDTDTDTDSDTRRSVKVESTSEMNPVKSTSISASKPEKPKRTIREHINNDQLSPKPKTGQKPSIIPRRSISTRK